jgi:hypothetical protein
MNPPDPKSGASTNSATSATRATWRIFTGAASADIGAGLGRGIFNHEKHEFHEKAVI